MRRRVLLLVLVSCLFVLSGIASASLPWAEYGGDAQNTGQSSYVGPQTTEYNWRTSLEGNNRDSFVSPVVDAAGSIYILDDAGQAWSEYVNGEWIYHPAQVPLLKAVNKDGTTKWRKEADIDCSAYRGNSSLALGTNGLLYISCWNKVYAIEADTGESRWDIAIDPYSSGSSTSAVGNLTIDSQNRLYIAGTSLETNPDGSQSNYHSVTAISDTGSILWRSLIGEGRKWDFTGPVLSPDQATIYLYRYASTFQNEQWFYGGFIAAVATETGQVKWEAPIEDGGTGWQTFTSFATDANGTIWVASYYKPDPNICYGSAEYLIGISPDGNIIRQMPLEGDMDCGSHVRIGPSGTVYITYDDARDGWFWDGTQWLYREWSWDGTQWMRYNSIWDGIQWILYESYPQERTKGGIAAYDPTTGFKWRFELPDSYEANGSPAIDANEDIYFAASFGEKLYSLNKDGQLNWEYSIAPGVEPTHGRNSLSGPAQDQLPYGAAPIIGLNGSVYVMGSLYLYGIDTRYININDGAVYATSSNVTLTLAAPQSSGASYMSFSDDGINWTQEEPYAATKAWTLQVGDGAKRVYAKFKDGAGKSSAEYFDEIILDSTLPTGSVVINNGDTLTSSPSVTLTISATDNLSGISQMCISNTITCSSWEPFNASKSWILDNSSDLMTVYVWFKDVAGNESMYSDSIILDLDGDGWRDSQDCNPNDSTIYPAALEIKHDGIDQDCNGYDLTINIITATYTSKTQTLTVEATSSLNSGANLQLAGYGAMSWIQGQAKWTKTVKNVSNPGTVTVSGIEGSTSSAVTVK